MSRISHVISGGQSGVDIAGWDAALACGLPTRGYMPKGFLTEIGMCPEYAERYGAIETRTAQYPPRTRLNVADSDVLLWFGWPHSAGGKLTLSTCRALKVPYLVFGDTWSLGPQLDDAAEFLLTHGPRDAPFMLGIAGSRESRAPGIGDRVESFLCQLFMCAKIRNWERSLIAR